MTDPAPTIAYLAEIIELARKETTSPERAAEAAAGKAYQLLAQSAAIAVQDAAAALRHAGIVANAAAGASIAEFLATGDPKYLEGVGRARELVSAAIADFSAVGQAAATILTEMQIEAE